MFDQSWRIEHYGRRIAAPAAGPGPECGEDRGSLWKGPVDSLLLDEEARPRIPLQEQARGQGRNRAGSAGGACERRMTIAEIAEEVGVSTGTVRYWLRSYG